MPGLWMAGIFHYSKFRRAGRLTGKVGCWGAGWGSWGCVVEEGMHKSQTRSSRPDPVRHPQRKDLPQKGA